MKQTEIQKKIENTVTNGLGFNQIPLHVTSEQYNNNEEITFDLGKHSHLKGVTASISAQELENLLRNINNVLRPSSTPYLQHIARMNETVEQNTGEKILDSNQRSNNDYVLSGITNGVDNLLGQLRNIVIAECVTPEEQEAINIYAHNQGVIAYKSSPLEGLVTKGAERSIKTEQLASKRIAEAFRNSDESYHIKINEIIFDEDGEANMSLSKPVIQISKGSDLSYASLGFDKPESSNKKTSYSSGLLNLGKSEEKDPYMNIFPGLALASGLGSYVMPDKKILNESSTPFGLRTYSEK